MLFMTTRNDSIITKAFASYPELFGCFVNPKANPAFVDLFPIWGMDNGAFGGFDEKKFWEGLEQTLPYRAACKFVVVPDVPFDWLGTLHKFEKEGWSARLRRLGFPAALAVQDGATVENIPWAEIDALFIGGSTEWKRAEYSSPLFPADLHPKEQIIQEAKQRGLWVHVGRQGNSIKQLNQAARFGADSVDGTCEVHAPKKQFRWICQTMWQIRNRKEGYQ